MNKIFIEQLCCATHIGVSQAEQEQLQFLLIDLEVCTTHMPTSDQLTPEHVDYAILRAHVRDRVSAYRGHLLETLAELLAQSVMKCFPVASLTLRISKKQAFSDVARVGVCIERTAHDCVAHS